MEKKALPWPPESLKGTKEDRTKEGLGTRLGENRVDSELNKGILGALMRPDTIL